MPQQAPILRQPNGWEKFKEKISAPPDAARCILPARGAPGETKPRASNPAACSSAGIPTKPGFLPTNCRQMIRQADRRIGNNPSASAGSASGPVCPLHTSNYQLQFCASVLSRPKCDDGAWYYSVKRNYDDHSSSGNKYRHTTRLARLQ